MELEFRMSVLRTRGRHVLVKEKKEEEKEEKEEAASKIFTCRLQRRSPVRQRQCCHSFSLDRFARYNSLRSLHGFFCETCEIDLRQVY